MALAAAGELAARTKDPRTGSYAAGYLGEIHESQGELDAALALTRRALFIAQSANAPESLYLWHWQAGRILRAQGAAPEARVSYELAVMELERLRTSAGVRRGESTTSFRDTVGPVYFGYVDLLLQQAMDDATEERSRAALVKARVTVESLKAADLRD